MNSSERSLTAGVALGSKTSETKRCRCKLRTFGIAVAGITVLGLGGTAWALPTPVGLGTATNAAVSSGASPTNTGTSTIAGDVDTTYTGSPAAPGYDPCVGGPPVNCVVYTTGTENLNNGVAAQVQADTTTARVNAQNATPTTAVLPELGGTTRPAGVYNTGAADITGVLTLDAANNPNSVWIFNAASSISTAIGSAVVFTNIPAGSTTASLSCNVFWTAVSSANLLGTTFVGTVMAQQSITVGAGVTVQGRLLAGSGDVTLISDTIDRPTCAVLPAGSGGSSSTTPGGTGATLGGPGSSTGGGSGSTLSTLSTPATPLASPPSSTGLTG